MSASFLKNTIMILLNSFFLLSMPGGSEWLLILVVVLIFFGGKKIPDLMKGVGRGIREFNDAKTNVKDEIEKGIKERDPLVAEKPSELPVV